MCRYLSKFKSFIPRACGRPSIPSKVSLIVLSATKKNTIFHIILHLSQYSRSEQNADIQFSSPTLQTWMFITPYNISNTIFCFGKT